MDEERERTTFLVIIVGALIAVLLGGFYWILHTSNIPDPAVIESVPANSDVPDQTWPLPGHDVKG